MSAPCWLIRVDFLAIRKHYKKDFTRPPSDPTRKQKGDQHYLVDNLADRGGHRPQLPTFMRKLINQGGARRKVTADESHHGFEDGPDLECGSREGIEHGVSILEDPDFSDKKTTLTTCCVAGGMKSKGCDA